MTNTDVTIVAALESLDHAIQFTELVLGQTPLFTQACSNMRSKLNLEGIIKAPYYQAPSAQPPIWLLNLCATIALTQKVGALIVAQNTNNHNPKIGFYGSAQKSIECALILQIIMTWIDAHIDLFIALHPHPTAIELERYKASIAVSAQSRLVDVLKDMMVAKELANAGMLN